MNQSIYQQKSSIKQRIEDDCINLSKYLYQKYSSSQSYFYTNKINEIIREKRTISNIFFEDIQYICDTQEYLKRWYSYREHQQKMFTFKEYYFYHQDCPRICMKHIDDIYTKWQDKKRDLIYKKLKLIYNENYNSGDEESSEKSTNNQPPISHFLNEISQFNPFSKNYYLRVQARKEKQQALKKQEQKINKSKFQLSNLKHQLSQMLDCVNDLSDISTFLDVADTPKKGKLYQTYTRKGILANKDGSHQMSTNSKSNSSIKFNFKKKSQGPLNYLSNQKLIDRKKSTDKQQNKDGIKHLPRKKIQKMKQPIKNTDLQLRHEIQVNRYKNVVPNSPRLIKAENNLNNLKFTFSVTSYGSFKNNINSLINNKGKTLKINYQTYEKQSSEFEHIGMNNNVSTHQKHSESKKPVKIIIKSKSTNKVNTPNQPYQNIKIRQISKPKEGIKRDQFSDKQFEEFNKFRSHKSQYSSSSSLKRPLFRISQQQNPILNFKRTLQLKHY